MKIKRFAIMTIVSGDKYREVWKRSKPYFEAYADTCGADLLVLENLPEGLPSPHWAKFSIYDLLKKQYDRIVFIDADIIIRPDTPSLFDIVPEDQFGIFNEGTFTPRAVCIQEVRKVFNVDLPKWNGKDYYNTGVMVISKCHRHLFKVNAEIKPLRNAFGEQTYLNMRLMLAETKLFPLPYKFNRMCVMDRNIGISRLDSYFIHYAGFDVLFGDGSMLKAMDRDINLWKQDAPEYKYKQRLFLWALGGLGDCIAAEPTIRYMRETLYPEAEIYIMTKDYLKCLFKHIPNVTFLEEGKILPDIDAVVEFNTHPTIYDRDNEFGSSFGNIAPHPFVHAIDWVSMSCINRQLTRAQKQIKLSYTEEDLDGILNKCSHPEELILVHPGKGWETKTFPVEWWQEIIDTLDEKDFKVGIIGSGVSKDHGYVPVICPTNGVDLRDKTTIPETIALIDNAPVVITNDSAPVFIAGAFDNYLIVIPTCKHGDMLVPFRHGSQEYKTACMSKGNVLNDQCARMTDLKGWQVAIFTNGRKIEDYIPDPQDVVKQAIQFFTQNKRLFCVKQTKEAENVTVTSVCNGNDDTWNHVMEPDKRQSGYAICGYIPKIGTGTEAVIHA